MADRKNRNWNNRDFIIPIDRKKQKRHAGKHRQTQYDNNMHTADIIADPTCEV